MRTRVLLFGTLKSSDKRAIVLGRDRDDVHIVAVDVPDQQVVWDADNRLPILTDAPGETLAGVLLEASDEDLRRLDWYEAIFGYYRYEIALPDGPAQTYRIQEGVPGDRVWVLDDWTAEKGPMVIEATREVMRYYPETPPTDVARVYGMLSARAASRLRAVGTEAPSITRAGAGRKGVTEHALKRRHRGFFALDELDVTHRRFDGGTERVTREVFLSTDATLMLPYDPDRDLVVLVEQFRAGPYRRGDPVPWSLEPVAGLIDAGESPEDCAHREAMEEAGLTLSALHAMPGGYPSPGATAEFYHLFIGIADLGGYRPRTGGLASEGEDILTHVLSLDAALGLLHSGEASVLPLAYMLFWTAANRDRLKTH